MKKLDGFEQREIAASFGYWSDPRWKIVHKLRKLGSDTKANSLVMKIRDDYGVD